MSAHTPGPWTWHHNSASTEDLHAIEIHSTGFKSVAHLQSYTDASLAYDDRDQTLADAVLVAAAPDLLEAAEAVEKWWLEQGMHELKGAPASIFAIRAAVAKATQP